MQEAGLSPGSDMRISTRDMKNPLLFFEGLKPSARGGYTFEESDSNDSDETVQLPGQHQDSDSDEPKPQMQRLQQQQAARPRAPAPVTAPQVANAKAYFKVRQPISYCT